MTLPSPPSPLTAIHKENIIRYPSTGLMNCILYEYDQ